MDPSTARTHLEALKKNPPRKRREDLGGVFNIEVYSVAAGTYILQHETRRPELAAEHLRDEKAEHKRVLAELERAARAS